MESQKLNVSPIDFDKAVSSNFLTKIDYEKGNAYPFYDLDEEVHFILNPMKVAYGYTFIEDCQNDKETCIGEVRENYEKVMQYIDEKFFQNAQIYNSNNCKEIAGNNDLSFYWCQNKKSFYNYNFEICFLIINIIITCLIVFLFQVVH